MPVALVPDCTVLTDTKEITKGSSHTLLVLTCRKRHGKAYSINVFFSQTIFIIVLRNTYEN